MILSGDFNINGLDYEAKQESTKFFKFDVSI